MVDYANRWFTRIREGARPAYLAIAELIAEDMKSGRLSAADRLPPLRTLAEQLGLNYTTVARGYAEARRRGLIDARVGRGTFVCSPSAARPLRSGGWVERRSAPRYFRPERNRSGGRGTRFPGPVGA